MESLKKRNWPRAICAMLAVLLVSMLALNFARSEQLEQAQTRINAVYQKAFYETCELTEAISANYRKLLVAGDQAQQQALIARISRDASVPAREICEAALSLASAAETSPLSHVGYYLIDEGLAELVARLYPKRRFLPPRLFFRLHGRPFYFVLSAFYLSQYQFLLCKSVL